MYKTGVYFGRFLPPHRGHLYQMIEASTRCEKLLVVISDNADQTREICRRDGIPEISYRLRKQWISQQIQDITHIGVRVLDIDFHVENKGKYNLYTNIYTLDMQGKTTYKDIVNKLSEYANIQGIRTRNT